MSDRIQIASRIGWTIASAAVVQGIVCTGAIGPVVALWSIGSSIFPAQGAARLLVLSAAIAPSYLLFALLLMPMSAAATRVTGWRAPENVEMRIADMSWELLTWVRAVIGAHLVQVCSGTFFRGTPVWTAYLRMAGARLGRRVYVNSLGVSDYNLLEFGDDVVIGADVHLSGHTVEAGVVKTARVRLGSRVTIGLSSIVEIGAEIGDDVQVGAMSFVPKHARLEGGHVYAGVPAKSLPAR